jgi:predicted O-methyltransferase YrrM
VSQDLLWHAFSDACNTPSDINEHVLTLAALAGLCKTVTEFGVRDGVSTTGLLHGLRDVGTYTGYDLEAPPPKLKALAVAGGVKYTHVRHSTLTTARIQPTDLLFIDTLHTYGQLLAELRLHGSRANRWIVLHDTETYGMIGEDGGWGLIPAYQDWLRENPQWKHAHTYKNNNGLTVLERNNG